MTPREQIRRLLAQAADVAPELTGRYEKLEAALTRLGALHAQLEDPAQREKLLTEEERQVWDTYLRPYEPFEVELSVIREIQLRSLGDLFEEEEALWKRYCMWREEQSQKRIPFHRRSAADLIQQARAYERAVSLHAPEAVLAEERLRLAEETVRYYTGKAEPVVWE